MRALQTRLDHEDIERLFQIFFQRPVGNDVFRDNLVAGGITAEQMIETLEDSEENSSLWQNWLDARVKQISAGALTSSEYRIPSNLRLSAELPDRILVIGSCGIGEFLYSNRRRYQKMNIDYTLFNNAAVLPEISAETAASYAFQVIQLPIRSIMPEGSYIGALYDEASAEARFELAKRRMLLQLEAAMAYCANHTVQSFVLNFLTPQQNPAGRLQPRYCYRNVVYFLDELNKALYAAVERYSNAYLIDTEQVASCLGKRFIQDDTISPLSHGSILFDKMRDIDENPASRLEPIGDLGALYSPRAGDFEAALFDEILAAYRSLRQQDMIKLVVFDLDDTLWRGVAAERDDVDAHMIEGWPLSLLECAHFLSNRGILLAIASKNDDDTIRRIWERLYGKLFPLDRFAAIRINWEPKSKNITEIIALANVRPDAVLFVDDNPVERAQVRSAIPGIRTLDVPWRSGGAPSCGPQSCNPPSSQTRPPCVWLPFSEKWNAIEKPPPSTEKRS